MSGFDFSPYQEPGLYLLWPDGNRLELTRVHISACTRRMLGDTDCIPESVRAAALFKPCAICPERHRAVICHAIMPVLPFLQEVDRYMSYDRVTALYREADSEILAVVETTMQQALKFVCLLSVISYCEVGQKFRHYFAGVNPLMSSSDMASVVYRNLFWYSEGDRRRVAATVLSMRDELLHTTRCQMERVKLVCRQDAFANAFVSTYTVIQVLFEMLDSHHGTQRPGAGPESTGGAADAAAGLDHGME